mgnify:CR=1 FL=1
MAVSGPTYNKRFVRMPLRGTEQAWRCASLKVTPDLEVLPCAYR